MRRSLVSLVSLFCLSSGSLVAAATEAATSAPGTVGTSARLPSPPTGPVTAKPGPGPGEVTFTWATKGEHTDYFTIETATTAFANGARDHTVFRVDPALRTYTLSAEQTARAHAGVGTGWTLVWRFRAVGAGSGGTEKRFFGLGQSRVPGSAPTGTGSPLRVASYNIRTANVRHPATLTWHRRLPRIARMIKHSKPGIVLVQELFPSMVRSFVSTLAQRGLGDYRLNRKTAVKTGAKGEHLFQSRILYDTTRYQRVGHCRTRVKSTDCLITWHADGGPDHASYLRLRDRASGQEFYVVSLHLPNGERYERLRRQAMRTIVEKTERINSDELPVVLGGDTNSSQLRKGVRPHDVLMDHGFYDTASAVKQVRGQFGTVNGFKHQRRSPFGISPRIDVIATRGMPGAATFVNEVIAKGDPFPSDHNMIWADLRLP